MSRDVDYAGDKFPDENPISGFGCVSAHTQYKDFIPEYYPGIKRVIFRLNKTYIKYILTRLTVPICLINTG